MWFIVKSLMQMRKTYVTEDIYKQLLENIDTDNYHLQHDRARNYTIHHIQVIMV